MFNHITAICLHEQGRSGHVMFGCNQVICNLLDGAILFFGRKDVFVAEIICNHSGSEGLLLPWLTIITFGTRSCRQT